jgi:hypothetical protein
MYVSIFCVSSFCRQLNPLRGELLGRNMKEGGAAAIAILENWPAYFRTASL